MRRAALVGAVCVLATACSEESGTNISGVHGLNIVRVDVAPTLDTLFVADTLRPGDRLQMAAQVIGRTGAPINGAKVAWSSSDHAVAIVTETGLVIPTGFGTTTITAAASKIAEATIVVLPATRTVQVTPPVDTIFVEDPLTLTDTVRFKATAYDENGQVVTGIAFSWTSSAATMGTVDGKGLVLGRSLGGFAVSARSGEQVGSGSVVVASAVKAIQVKASAATVLARDTVQLTATALGYDDKPMSGRTFKWTSSDPTVATVDDNGRAIFLRAGSVAFTAKSAFTTSTTVVTALERQFQRISSGDDFTCGFTNLGRGYCWGVGDLGQLATAADSTCFDGMDGAVRGGGTFPCTLAPKRHDGAALEFTAMDVGATSACGITSDRMVYCWGSDEFGQIGNGLKGAGTQPVLATVAQERFDSITVGGEHACGLNTGRRAYCWGLDAFGQLGDNRLINSTTPIPVLTNLTFSSISAGGRHTCGISNGLASCWGANDSGQIGIGVVDGVPHMVPVAVQGGQTFIAISAGAEHTCGLTSGGQVVCWGANNRGQIGSAPGAPVPTPTPLAGGPFVAISAGKDHTCALAASGAVSCWGWNGWGQTGNGTENAVAGLGTVAGGLTFRSVTAGYEHTCAIATDGETYCWGSNVFGTLGNELQAASRATPQRVAAPR